MSPRIEPALFSPIVQALPDAAIVINEDGHICMLNARAERLFGYRADELLGQTIEALVPPRVAESHVGHRKRYLAHPEARPMGSGLPLSGRKKDGGELAIDVSLSPVSLDGRPHTLALVRDVTRYRRQAFGQLVGHSPAMECLLSQVAAVSPTHADVLLIGESGVGKELIAKALHEKSPRARGPFVKVNCASIPRELFESEFFGHVRGAFTGAIDDRTGRFALADGGTLLLDEVGEIPVDLQGKLLRVLQERELEPIGGQRTLTVDVRVIAATNRDLAQEVEAGRFREDLYYRLNVFPIRVPPLRDRGDDVVVLAEHLIGALASRLGVRRAVLTETDRHALLNHRWPGNVRELSNVIERALILSVRNDGRLDLTDVISQQASEAPWRGRSEASDVTLDERRIITAAELKAFEKANIERALVRAEGRIGGSDGAAELLGMSRTTLASRIKALGVSRPPSSNHTET